MSEKWLLSRCEGYEVRIDEVSAKLQAPVVRRCTKGNWGFPGVSPGPFFGSFLAAQKGTRVGTRNIPFAAEGKVTQRCGETSPTNTTTFQERTSYGSSAMAHPYPIG